MQRAAGGEGEADLRAVRMDAPASAVSITGTVTITAPAMAPAMSGFMLAAIRDRRSGPLSPVPKHKAR